MRCAHCYRRLPPARACPLHQGVTAPPEVEEELQPPTVAGIGPLALVGQGGMAVVWRGLRGGDDVAVKVAREGGEERLAREAEALRRLGSPAAPALVAEARTAEGAPCLVMELVGGTTLADMLAAREEPAMPPAEAVALVRAIAAALAPVSAAGWVHRDLKPENVFLVPGGGARLIDFGLARPVGWAVLREHDPSLTQTGQRLGTATYMAPEQCRSSRQVDARADAYALAVMAFELVTGRPPFVGEVAAVIQAHVARRPARPSSLAPAAAPLDEAILRGLAKDPAERFAGATELGDALAVALAAVPTAPSPARRESVALRPVALVGIRTAEPVSRLGGDVVAVAGDRAVLAFADASLEVALRAAARAARALLPLSADGRIVVHAAPLRVRRGARGLVAMGAALGDLDAWWGAEGSGVVLTSEASAAGETGDTPPGAPRAEAIRLHGRDSAIADVAAPLALADRILAMCWRMTGR